MWQFLQHGRNVRIVWYTCREYVIFFTIFQTVLNREVRLLNLNTPETLLLRMCERTEFVGYMDLK